MGKRRSKNVPQANFLEKDIQGKINEKAYELWQKRGCCHGNDWVDWFEAEKSVQAGKR